MGSAGAIDVGPEAAQPLVDALVAPVDLADVADDRFAVGGQGGQQQGHAGADVGGLQALAVQLGGAVDDHPVGVADDDPGPHADQLVHEHQPVLEHLLEDQHRAPGLGGDRDRDRGQVGRERRPGAVVDGGDGLAEVVLDLQGLVAGDPQAAPLQLPGQPEAAEADLDRPQVVLEHALDHQLAAGDRGQADEAGHLDVVGADGVLAAAEPVDPLDGQEVGPDPGDAGPQADQEPAQVLDVGLAGGVADDRGPIGQHGGHDGILGGRDRRLVEEHRRPPEPPHLQLQGPVEAGMDPQAAEGQQVGVEPPPADHVPAGRGQQAVAGPGDQRRRQQHRGPDAGAQGRVEGGPAQAAGVDADLVGAELLHARAGRGDQLQHGVDVQDLGDVAQHHRLVGQQAGGHDGQRGVLVPGRADGAAQRLPALDDEALHDAPSSRPFGGTAAYSTVAGSRPGQAPATTAVAAGSYTGRSGAGFSDGEFPPVPAFKLLSDMPAAGDQPAAIDAMADALEGGEQGVTLLGVTGSGKTRSMAGVIERLNRPALVMATNKTLAAQLTNEFKELFPDNAVEYFVSYYDYYQPEAYIPQTDTYIEKDSSMNEEIDRLRHSATLSLLTRRDVIVVASVSAIYGLGSPQEYRDQMLWLKRGESYDRDGVLRKLVDIHYDRNDLSFVRGKFRVRGDTLEVFPAYEERAMRLEFFGDEVERILVMD